MKKILPIFVIIALALVSAFAQTTSPQLQQLQRDLREQQRIRDLSTARVGSLAAEIKNLGARERNFSNQVQTLSKRLTKLEQERVITQQQLAKTEDKSQSLSLEIQMLEAKIAYGKEQLAKLIITLDRERSNRYVKLVVRAENAFDLAVKAKDLDTIQDVNLNVINELQVNTALLTNKNQQFIAVIAKLNQYQRILEQKKAEINKNRATLNANIVELQKTRAGRKSLQLQAIESAQAASANASSLFSGIVSERNRLAEIRRQKALEAQRRREAEARRQREEAARIARIRSENARQRAAELEKRRQTQAQVQIARVEPIALPASVSRFQFPMPGGSIASDFGSEGNDYMTIQGSAGSSVTAAADGTVSRVTTIGANYGYFVVIAHTSDLTSLITYYGNLQYPIVEVGQSVRAGQVIGNVGGGALFPNNELHFYVARNGYNVNPRPYL